MAQDEWLRDRCFYALVCRPFVSCLCSCRPFLIYAIFWFCVQLHCLQDIAHSQNTDSARLFDPECASSWISSACASAARRWDRVLRSHGGGSARRRRFVQALCKRPGHGYDPHDHEKIERRSLWSPWVMSAITIRPQNYSEIVVYLETVSLVSPKLSSNKFECP
jgi:hypothetical protein